MANSFYDMDSIKYEYDYEPETIFDYFGTPVDQEPKSLPMPLVPVWPMMYARHTEREAMRGASFLGSCGEMRKKAPHCSKREKYCRFSSQVLSLTLK